MLDHDIVVATRNRLDMLRLTLPLFIAQSRKANRIIVVDRSDDHRAVREFCDDLAVTAGAPIQVHYGEAANLPAQRNQGLRHVTSPVVLFPDDDSMWYPDTAESILRVYDSDERELYGAVSAVDVYQPHVPLDDTAPRRQTRLTEQQVVMNLRNRVEAWLFPQPFEVYGRARSADLAGPARAAGLTHPLVGTIGGYRMSFRSDTITRIGFDPVLGSRVGYGTHEDKDAALRVLRAGQLIAVAEQARVFHNAHPGKRAGGVEYGFFHIFNYAYICRKLMPEGSAGRRALAPYLRYKVTLYRLRRGDRYDRDVARGARRARRESAELMQTSDADLADAYARICDRALAALRRGET